MGYGPCKKCGGEINYSGVDWYGDRNGYFHKVCPTAASPAPARLLIPVLGIPHYNRPDLTLRCLRSIDYPVRQVVLVDQSPSPIPIDIGEVMSSLRTPMGLCRIRHPNAGVAGAWNEIIKLFPAPWWMIVNNDIEFSPGDLERMAQRVEQDLVLGKGLFYGNHGASWFALTSACVARVGLFDENIYPAYLEDCDYARRCDLLGVPRVNVEGCRAIHGTATDPADASRGSCTVNATPELARQNATTHGRNFDYYRAKWGGINGQEVFETPFNNPRCPVWAWRFDPQLRQLQQWSKE